MQTRKQHEHTSSPRKKNDGPDCVGRGGPTPRVCTNCGTQNCLSTNLESNECDNQSLGTHCNLIQQRFESLSYIFKRTRIGKPNYGRKMTSQKLRCLLVLITSLSPQTNRLADRVYLALPRSLGIRLQSTKEARRAVITSEVVVPLLRSTHLSATAKRKTGVDCTRIWSI